MKSALVLAVLVLAACKKPQPLAETPAPPAAGPALPQPAEKMDPDAAMKYVTGLQADVKRASEAKAKADAANKKAAEANKIP